MSERRQPNLYVLAGPNGAGKSTFARLFLPDYADCKEFVNADLMPLLHRLRRMGYRLHLFFLWIPTPELAIDRVQTRVRSGGHSIPEEVVRRRFGRGLRNFFQVYAPIMDAWLIFDGSRIPPDLVAFWVSDQRFIFDRDLLQRIEREGKRE